MWPDGDEMVSLSVEQPHWLLDGIDLAVRSRSIRGAITRGSAERAAYWHGLIGHAKRYRHAECRGVSGPDRCARRTWGFAWRTAARDGRARSGGRTTARN
ncbi:hypothetical protein [Burkholderia oklahomensis]|uniref:hypothetical protein n=1 Tax=Burkholderia oklahomensis TaxID=342113 RepID=UPI0039C8A8EA